MHDSSSSEKSYSWHDGSYNSHCINSARVWILIYIGDWKCYRDTSSESYKYMCPESGWFSLVLSFESYNSRCEYRKNKSEDNLRLLQKISNKVFHNNCYIFQERTTGLYELSKKAPIGAFLYIHTFWDWDFFGLCDGLYIFFQGKEICIWMNFRNNIKSNTWVSFFNIFRNDFNRL